MKTRRALLYLCLANILLPVSGIVTGVATNLIGSPPTWRSLVQSVQDHPGFWFAFLATIAAVNLVSARHYILSIATAELGNVTSNLQHLLHLRNRRRLLDQVYTRIAQNLNNDLYRQMRIELALGFDMAAVVEPWKRMLEPGGHAVPYPGAKLGILDHFNGFNRSLLILGKPGAGKTTLLLELAKELVDEARGDEVAALPVLFNLSSWAGWKPPLEVWMIDELFEQYGVPRPLATSLVEHETILPLLDGLDEVSRDDRSACATEINAFRRRHGLLPIVVCSRTDDYGDLPIRLNLHGAVSVAPLTPAQVDEVVAASGPALEGIALALEKDPALYELLETPLMLSIAFQVFGEGGDTSILETGTIDARRDRLFREFVARMYERRRHLVPWDRAVVGKWLSWLALRLRREGRSTFYVEFMQPDWLTPRYAWLPIAVPGLFGFVFVGLPFGALLFVSARTPTGEWIWSLPFGAEVWVNWVGIGFFVFLSTVFWFNDRIEPCERFSFWWPGPPDWAAVRTAVPRWGGVGFVIGFGFGMYDAWRTGFDAWLFGAFVASGLVGGLAFGSVGACTDAMWDRGLRSQQIPERHVPNEGIKRSARNALFFIVLIVPLGLSIGVLLFSILFFSAHIALRSLVGNFGYEFDRLGSLGNFQWLVLLVILFPFFFRLFAWIIAGLVQSLRPVLQHIALRCLLAVEGNAPLHYPRFLDACADLNLVRKDGGGYRFLHRALADWFVDQLHRENEAALRASITAQPTNFISWKNLFDYFIDNGLFLKAIYLLREMADIGDRNHSPHIAAYAKSQIAFECERRGDWQECENLLLQCVNHSQNIIQREPFAIADELSYKGVFYWRIAQCRFSMRDYDQAIMYLSRAIDLHLYLSRSERKQNLAKYFELTGDCHVIINQLDDAIAALSSASDIYSSCNDTLSQIRTFNKYTEAFRLAGNFEGAEYGFQLVISEEKNLIKKMAKEQQADIALEVAKAHLGLGSVYRDQGDRQRAEQMYLQALERFGQVEHAEGARMTGTLLSRLKPRDAD